MLTFNDIAKLKSLFQNNQNIIQYIKSNTNMDIEEAILHSYDLQAGSYISALVNTEVKMLKKHIGIKLADLLKKLNINCVCEVGVGEATTLCHVLSSIQIKEKFAFDISMSRLLYGQKYLKANNIEVNLFCAELLHIPFADNAIECVYSYHSLEPNGGKEQLLLNELLRITQKYLILIEPDYDLFSEEQKNRMDQHNYSKHLHNHLTEMGANIICYEPWELDSNPLNKASLIIVEKNHAAHDIDYVSPVSHKPLIPVEEGLFCKEDGFLFPIVKNIPVLLRKNAILISHYGK